MGLSEVGVEGARKKGSGTVSSSSISMSTFRSLLAFSLLCISRILGPVPFQLRLVKRFGCLSGAMVGMSLRGVEPGKVRPGPFCDVASLA